MERRRLTIRLGSDWFFNPAYVLQVAGRILVGISEVADYGGLDLDVRGADGRPLLQMVANDWNLETLPNDLIVGNRYNHPTVDLSRTDPLRDPLPLVFEGGVPGIPGEGGAACTQKVCVRLRGTVAGSPIHCWGEVRLAL